MQWLRRIFRLDEADPFALTQSIKASVSPVELKIFRIDADRNGITLHDWIRSTLNKGVSADTMRHLSKGVGEDIDVLNTAFELLEDHELLGGNAAPVRKKYMKISGHPCRHLNPEIPQNYTKASCQGSCNSRHPGYGGRPCFWGAPVAKDCDAFQAKTIPIAKPKH